MYLQNNEKTFGDNQESKLMKKMKVEDSNKLLNSGDSKNSDKDETSKLFFEKNCIKKFVLLMNIF